MQMHPTVLIAAIVAIGWSVRRVQCAYPYSNNMVDRSFLCVS